MQRYFTGIIPLLAPPNYSFKMRGRTKALSSTIRFKKYGVRVFIGR